MDQTTRRSAVVKLLRYSSSTTMRAWRKAGRAYRARRTGLLTGSYKAHRKLQGTQEVHSCAHLIPSYSSVYDSQACVSRLCQGTTCENWHR